MYNIRDVPREEVQNIVSEVTLSTEAIEQDICYIKDPNVAAILLCLGKILIKIKIAHHARFGNKPPQRIIAFGFDGHDDCMAFAINAKLNLQPSTQMRNVNIGEYTHYLSTLKTIIHSIF